MITQRMRRANIFTIEMKEAINKMEEEIKFVAPKIKELENRMKELQECRL